MSFDRRRHGTISTDRPLPSAQRHIFLEVLSQKLRETYKVRTGVVLERSGAVLLVTDPWSGLRSIQVGCDMNDNGWWYTWPADDGREFDHVEDLDDAAKTVIRELHESKGSS